MKGMIIVPACNEGASLQKFLPRLHESLTKISEFNISVVVINDGSDDNTVQVAEECGCRVVTNKRNRGNGYSIRRGLQLALEEQCTFVVTMDADGQHDEKLLPTILAQFGEGAEVIIASRYHLESQRIGVPDDRDMLNIMARSIIHALTGWWQLTDPLCGFWVINRRVLQFLTQELKQDRYGVFLESIIKLWYLCDPRPKLIEVPHPAIYRNHDELRLLTREYSPANRLERTKRFDDHANQMLEVLDDVRSVVEIDAELEHLKAEWRKHETRPQKGAEVE